MLDAALDRSDVPAGIPLVPGAVEVAGQVLGFGLATFLAP